MRTVAVTPRRELLWPPPDRPGILDLAEDLETYMDGNTETNSPVTRIASIGHSAGRWLWTIVYVSGIVAAALVLADTLQSLVEPAMTKQGLELPAIFGLSARRVAIAGLSIGLMLSTANRLWNVLVPLYRYALRDQDFDFLKNLMAILAPCFLLTFAYYSVQRAAGPDPDAEPVADWSVRYIAPFRPSAERHAVFPFLFGPGRLDGERIVAGYELSRDHKIAIVELVDAFRPCAAANSPVSLQVLGYASSRAFDGLEAPRFAEFNRHLNTELANLRGRAVHDSIVDAIAGSTTFFEIQLIEHRSYDDMKKSLAFNDRPLGATIENDAELFTRSAHVRIDSAGRCEFSESTIERAR